MPVSTDQIERIMGVQAPQDYGDVLPSATDWASLLSQYADWSQETMLRIIACESGGDENAVSPGGANVGAYQLNVVHGFSYEAMTDPQQSTRLAHEVYLSQGYSAWSCY